MANLFETFLQNLRFRGKCRCGVPLDHPGICDRCSEKRDRRELTAMFEAARESIPEHFRKAKFDSLELSGYCGADSARAGLAMLDDLLAKTVDGITLMGQKGSGKTSLACAMLRAAIDRQHLIALRGRFISCVDLGLARKDCRLGAKPWIVEDAEKASLLVLDELGKEADKGPIIEVICTRHDNEKPTIITTPWLESELCAGYDGGIARRILERSAVLRMG